MAQKRKKKHNRFMHQKPVTVNTPKKQQGTQIMTGDEAMYITAEAYNAMVNKPKPKRKRKK